MNTVSNCPSSNHIITAYIAKDVLIKFDAVYKTKEDKLTLSSFKRVIYSKHKTITNTKNVFVRTLHYLLKFQ